MPHRGRKCAVAAAMCLTAATIKPDSSRFDLGHFMDRSSVRSIFCGSLLVLFHSINGIKLCPFRMCVCRLKVVGRASAKTIGLISKKFWVKVRTGVVSVLSCLTSFTSRSLEVVETSACWLYICSRHWPLFGDQRQDLLSPSMMVNACVLRLDLGLYSQSERVVS